MILALWAISLLSAFAVILGYQVRQKLTFAYRLDERERLNMIAESGIRRAMSTIITDAQERTVSSLGDAWSWNEQAFKDIVLAGGSYSIGYKFWDQAEEKELTWYGLVDEERKINLNTADLNVLRRLFEVGLGLDETQATDLAASIVDWRDEDNQLATPTAGAEDSYYRSLSHSYESKDAPFEVPEELLLVKGMTPELYDILQDYVTVYGEGKVNINTASEQVLSALGLGRELADDIGAFRKGTDEAYATGDDNVFEDTASVVEQLSQSYALAADEINQLNQLLGILTVNSQYFSIRSTAQSPDKKYGSTILCVVDREGSVLYRRQF